MTDSASALPVGAVVQPCPAPQPAPTEYWLEIELVGEDDQPLPWEEYRVRLPDGQEVGGYLDAEGYARLENLTTSGNCMVSFPALDRDAWESIAALPAKGA